MAYSIRRKWAAGSSYTLERIYQNARSHIPEYRHLYHYRCPPAFKIQRYEYTYNLSVYSIRCITGTQNSFL